MAKSRLYKNLTAFYAECNPLLRHFLARIPSTPACGLPCVDRHVLTQELCILRLYDAWARFCRELIITSAYAGPVGISGGAVSAVPGIGRRSEVLPALRATFSRPKPIWWEPKWPDAVEALDAAQRLRLSNYSRISSGLALSPSPIDDIRRIRNFIAHRNQHTAIEANRVILAAGCLPGNPVVFASTVIPPGVTVFEKWVSDLYIIAELACN